MTPRIPISLCRKCPHFRGYCPLTDLDPCPQAEQAEELRLRNRIGWAATLIVALLSAALLLSSCRRAPEPQPVIPTWSAVELLRQQHKGELSEYEKLILAIAFTESRWNPDAVGKNGDLGFLQITPVYVQEANRVSGANFKHEDAFSIDSSLAMFAAIQSHYNPSRDIEQAIYRHNKSPQYRKTVLENLEMIDRYEALRKKLVEKH